MTSPFNGMKYKTANQEELNGLLAYLSKLVGQEAVVNLTKVNPRHSLSQNAFLHLLIQAFSVHFGWTAEEGKTYYKREINPDIYVYEKNGIKFLRSSSELDVAQMTKSIDRLRSFSAEQGYPLPTADNSEALMQLENLVESQELYL